MTDCLVLIQLNREPLTAFEKPLLKEMEGQVSNLVTFDFDGFSEETIRQYALDLIRQSRQAAILVEVKDEQGPHSGLVSFFNKLLQQKHPKLLMVQEGDLPPQLEKMMKVLGGPNYRYASSTQESKEHILPFLQNP